MNSNTNNNSNNNFNNDNINQQQQRQYMSPSYPQPPQQPPPSQPLYSLPADENANNQFQWNQAQQQQWQTNPFNPLHYNASSPFPLEDKYVSPSYRPNTSTSSFPSNTQQPQQTQQTTSYRSFTVPAQTVVHVEQQRGMTIEERDLLLSLFVFAVGWCFMFVWIAGFCFVRSPSRYARSFGVASVTMFFVVATIMTILGVGILLNSSPSSHNHNYTDTTTIPPMSTLGPAK